MNSLFQNMARLQVKAPNYEPEAIAFFNKGVALGEASLSNPFKEAVNDWFKAAKNDGFYSKLKVVRLNIGGTAVWHSINAVDPDNHQSTFVGSPTHNSNGVTYNGTTQYCDQNYARNLLTVDNFSFGFYSNPATGSVHASYEFGIEDTSGANKSLFIAARLPMDRHQTVYGSDASNVTDTTGGGFFSMVARDAGGGNTQIEKYKNGASVDDDTIATSNISLSTLDFFSGALNSDGLPAYFSSRNFQFEYISEALSDAEMLSLYNAVLALETAVR